MQLNGKVSGAINQIIKKIERLKGEEVLRVFTDPSIDLFFSSLPGDAKSKLRLQLIGMISLPQTCVYPEVIKYYQNMQMQYLTHYIADIDLLLTTLLTNKERSAEYLEKIIDFFESCQLSVLAVEMPMVRIFKINPAIKFRITYFLVDMLADFLQDIRNDLGACVTLSSEHALVKKLEIACAAMTDEKDKRNELNTLFLSELQIREASILATGELPRVDQLSDIFNVYYRAAGYGMDHTSQSDISAIYFQLFTRTLGQVSKVTNLLQNFPDKPRLSLSIRPVSHETSMSVNGLVQRSKYGVDLTYEENRNPNDMDAGFNNQYQVTDYYQLSATLKIAFLMHIQQLSEQVANSPKHVHYERRAEKLAALCQISEAERQGCLSPSTFTQAKTCKPHLYAAFFSRSRTQELITQAELDVRLKLWQRLVVEKYGQYGHPLSDELLVKKIIEKYKTFSEVSYDHQQSITQLMTPSLERAQLENHELWRFDKKMALTIILVAHQQKLLHPALIQAIEENFGCIYARTLPWIFGSHVESLIKAVKEDILSSFWRDAKNDQSSNVSPKWKNYYV